MNSVAYVDWHFARREKIRRVKIGAMLLFGIPLSFLGPLLLSTMFWLAMTFGLRFSDFASGVRWLDVFVVLTAVMVPLLYRLETRTGGEYRTDLSDPGVATGQMALRAAVVGGPFAAGLLGVGTLVNARATSSAFVEFFLLGPRLVVSALRQFTLSRRLHLADRQRAAGIVALLLGRSDGVDTDHLLHEGEELGGLLPVLAYLVYYQWIGAGEKWRRVWLDSETRRVISG